MALATDKDGLPLDYGLYKGNQAEGATMVPFVDELKKNLTSKLHCRCRPGPQQQEQYRLFGKAGR